MAEQLTSQSAGGGSIPTPSLQIRRIDKKTSIPVIEKYHYSQNVPAGKNIYFGYYVNEDLLYAVAIYGIGVNNNGPAYLARVTGRDVTVQNSLELKRLARIEPKIDAAPDDLLAICHRLLKKEGYKSVVKLLRP